MLFMERSASGLSEVGIVKECVIKQIISQFVMVLHYICNIPFCVHSSFILLLGNRLAVVQNKCTEKCYLVFMAISSD